MYEAPTVEKSLTGTSNGVSGWVVVDLSPRRTAANLLANLGYFAVITLVGMWYTSYLLSRLGVAAYGLIPLVSTVVGYGTVITQGLGAAVSRGVVRALTYRNVSAINSVFTTSVVVTGIVASVLAGLLALVALHVDSVLHVPDAQEAEARWLFGLAALAFLLTTIRTPFDTSTFSTNRLDLRNMVALGETLVRVAVVVALFHTLQPRPSLVGVAIASGALAGTTGSLILWRRLMPQVRLRVTCIQTAEVRSLFFTSTWVSVNTLGSLLLLAVDLLVVNRLLGPEAAGYYAPLLQWSALLRNIGNSITGVFAPGIFHHYSTKDADKLASYARKALHLCALDLALPGGLISGFARPLLHTWLGANFAQHAGVLLVLTLHLSVNLAVQPLFSLQTAADKVRLPALVTLGTGAFNLGLAVLMVGPLGFGLYGAALAGAITLSVKNLVFTPSYAAAILGRKWNVFINEALVGVTATGAVTLLAFGVSLLGPTGWLELLLGATLVSVAYLGLVWFFVLSPAERQDLSTIWGTVSTGCCTLGLPH